MQDAAWVLVFVIGLAIGAVLGVSWVHSAVRACVDVGGRVAYINDVRVCVRT